MPRLIDAPPSTPIESVTELLHGQPVSDPYRWLEDQESLRVRQWLAAQTLYARSFLDSLPARNRIRKRVRELVDVETYDSIQRIGNWYFFRKRQPGEEQACIFRRPGVDGADELLVDPAQRGGGKYASVKPLRISPNGRFLLYEVKEGGERTASFEILDVEERRTLPDVLPRGYLRSFAFTSDNLGFYFVHEPVAAARANSRAAYHHLLGTDFGADLRIFLAEGAGDLRLSFIAADERLGFLVQRFLDKTYTDFYLWREGAAGPARLLLERAAYRFVPRFVGHGRVLAITNLEAPNLRIVELGDGDPDQSRLLTIVPEDDWPIQSWVTTRDRIFVSYIRSLKPEVDVFDLAGNAVGRLPVEESDSVRLVGGGEDELMVETESFRKPIQIHRYCSPGLEAQLWAARPIPFDSRQWSVARVWFSGKDGTRIPMSLVGSRSAFETGPRATIMTSYGGYGVSATPQFSAFAAFFLELGCLFALPNIRGGSEFGSEWHQAARRRNHQVAVDDFLAASEWLLETGRTRPQRLAIFGGSNSGLLVGAAMTQRPELFRAVLCMVPLLDMLRYHLFDTAYAWKDEFGTADNPEDFRALAGYSPYHRVRDGEHYPGIMLVSGDADQNCNPLHARKMTARLQAASASQRPIVLDYHPFRGHSPVLPLSARIEALTDRVAFFCDQLELRL